MWLIDILRRFLIGDHTGRLFITMLVPVDETVELHIDYIGEVCHSHSFGIADFEDMCMLQKGFVLSLMIWCKKAIPVQCVRRQSGVHVYPKGVPGFDCTHVKFPRMGFGAITPDTVEVTHMWGRK